MTIGAEELRAARLPSLTGLRWIAALLVFLFHVTDQARYITGSAGDVLGDVLARSGYVAVSFFFLLSGFVLTWSARPGERATGIWRRRLVKIYPNHFVTFLLAAVLMLIAAEKFTTKGILTHLFLVQTWVPDVLTWKTMNVPSWSLACELLFYLSFPLLLGLLNRVPVRRLWALAGALTALILIVPLVSRYAIGGVPLPFFEGSPSFEQIWFVYLFPPVRALEFVLGMVLARLVMAGVWPRIGLLPACLIAVGGYVVTLKVPFLFGIGGTAVLWLVPLVAAAALADITGAKSPFRGRVLIWLGDISFAFYMVQGLVAAYAYLWFVMGEGLSPAAGAAVLVAVFVVCLVLSYALYTLVERPLMRRFSRPRQPAAPAPVPVPVPAARPLATTLKADD